MEELTISHLLFKDEGEDEQGPYGPLFIIYNERPEEPWKYSVNWIPLKEAGEIADKMNVKLETI